MSEHIRPPEDPPHVLLLKRVLLLGWAVWLSVVLATNVADALKVLGLLAEDWSFASGNYGFVASTTARYGPPAWLNGILFAGVIAWEAAAAGLFWLASLTYRGAGQPLVYAAFTASLSLWLAFAVADEVCVAYPVEATHLRLLIAQLATLLAVELLPGRGRER
jgi:hypothetical protein